MTNEYRFDIDESEFDPTIERTPVVLILDNSGSMNRYPDNREDKRIELLNEGLDLLKNKLCEYDDTEERVDIAIISVKGETAKLYKDFEPVDTWEPTNLTAGDNTPLYSGIQEAIELQHAYKKSLRNIGVPVNRRYLFLLSDGKPTYMDENDKDWNEITRKIEEGEQGQHFVFVSMAMGNADIDRLSRLVGDTEYDPIKPDPSEIERVFEHLAGSIGAHSRKEDDVARDFIGSIDDE